MFSVFIVMYHVLKNINQLDFALYVVILKILHQILFRRIRVLGTLVIAIVEELLTLILQFINISDQFILKLT